MSKIDMRIVAKHKVNPRMSHQKDVQPKEDCLAATGNQKERQKHRDVDQQENNIAGFIAEIAPSGDDAPFFLPHGIHFMHNQKGQSEIKN